MSARYGFAQAFLNSDPELKKLFQTAVKKGWEVPMFVARLRATKWFQRNSATVRNAILQKTSDPATYKAKVAQMRAQVNDVWGKAYGGGTIDQKTLDTWAETAYRMGWSEEQLMDTMGASLNYQQLLTSQNLGGTAAEARAQLRELNSNYGLDLGDTWMNQNLKRVMVGNDTISGIQARVRDLAKKQYQAFAEDIDGGRTVAELADPYVQKMADLLEMNPSSIKLKDTSIQRAMTMRDAQGVPTAQNLNDFANDIRKDTRWQYTANAKAQTAEVTSQLLRSFGVI